MMIDSYAHVSLKKYLPVESLLEEMERTGIDRAVLVQPMGDYDNSYLYLTRAPYADKFAIVGLIDVQAHGALSELERLVGAQGFEGARFPAEGLAQDALIEKMAALDGVLLLHLPAGVGQYASRLVAVARRWPRLRINVPHLGWPRSYGQQTAGWHDAVAALAEFPNITFSISAVYYYSAESFPHRDTWGWISFLLEKLGPSRCLFASDFPLLLEAESYRQYYTLLDHEEFHFSPDARRLVLGEAGARFWKMKL